MKRTYETKAHRGHLHRQGQTVGDDMLDCCAALEGCDKAQRAADPFIPGFQMTTETAGGRQLLRFGPVTIDYSTMQDTVYRKIRCSHPACLSWKWANEFDWNRNGLEGPIKKFWGKRDCWCKACRSKAKSQKRREHRTPLRRRNGANTIDLTEFAVIEKFSPCGEGHRQQAYRDLLDRVFFGMTQK